MPTLLPGTWKRHNGLLPRPASPLIPRLIDSGGDWDRRNRLKAYQGIYLLSIRSFVPAAELLLDVLSTFTSTELMSFEDVVMYAVLAGSISLPRVDLKTKVVDLPPNAHSLRSSTILKFCKSFPVTQPWNPSTDSSTRSTPENMHYISKRWPKSSSS